MAIEINKSQSIFEIGQRSNMEDCVYPSLGSTTERDRLFILCDGMGGHERGEVASAIVCRAVAGYFKAHPREYSKEAIVKALNAAQDELDRFDTGNMRQMGTTLALLLFGEDSCLAAHIGDSRIYHIRPQSLEIRYKSCDHSLVNELFLAGEITEEEMMAHPRKNVITRAIIAGQEKRPKVDIAEIIDIQSGDYFYLCSDGMLEQMNDTELVELLSADCSDTEKRDILVERTDQNKDNHSAILIHIKYSGQKHYLSFFRKFWSLHFPR